MAQQPLIRPAQIDQLPLLAEDKKTYWRDGLAKLWQQHDSYPAGSPQRQQIEIKLRQASTRIMQELSNGQNQRSGGGGGGNARPGSGGGAQPPRPPNQGNVMGQQAGASQQGGAKPGNPSQPAPPQQGTAMSAQTKETLRNITVHIPANNTDPLYKSKWFQKATGILGQREKAVQYGKSLQPKVAEYSANGQPLPQQLQAGYDRAKNAVHELGRQWEAMKSENEAVARRNQALQGGQGQQQPQQIQRQGTSNAQGDVKQESRVSQSPPQPQTGFQQQPQQTVNQGASAQTKQQQNFPPQTPQQTPQTATQQQPPQQNFQQPQQQQYSNHQRPQLNPQFSQQSQTPQQNPSTAPNNANQQQRPQALSQQAAMAQAAAQYANGNQQQSQTGSNQHQYPAQPQIPNGMPFNQQPGSATQPTPNSGFPQQPSLQPTQTNHNKFPINKTMMLNPANQQPVNAPPARPTLNNAGVLQQPGVTRQPPFTLEGDGDRVLSKRKLDELVRQVTGGGEDGFLSPEVEELALSYVDDFVDNVITAACKLAKAKPSQTLDIKDFQIALERNYGIRIPGYSLDEVRSVKKFQPAPGWHSKMQAIQTAKTLGGVGKSDS